LPAEYITDTDAAARFMGCRRRPSHSSFVESANRGVSLLCGVLPDFGRAAAVLPDRVG
jgi:hypothetical protein